MNTKRYKLLKDLPSVKAGTEFLWSHEDQWRATTEDNNLWDLPESVLIKYPEWFSPIEEVKKEIEKL